MSINLRYTLLCIGCTNLHGFLIYASHNANPMCLQNYYDCTEIVNLIKIFSTDMNQIMVFHIAKNTIFSTAEKNGRFLYVHLQRFSVYCIIYLYPKMILVKEKRYDIRVRKSEYKKSKFKFTIRQS